MEAPATTASPVNSPKKRVLQLIGIGLGLSVIRDLTGLFTIISVLEAIPIDFWENYTQIAHITSDLIALLLGYLLYKWIRERRGLYIIGIGITTDLLSSVIGSMIINIPFFGITSLIATPLLIIQQPVNILSSIPIFTLFLAAGTLIGKWRNEEKTAELSILKALPCAILIAVIIKSILISGLGAGPQTLPTILLAFPFYAFFILSPFEAFHFSAHLEIILLTFHYLILLSLIIWGVRGIKNFEGIKKLLGLVAIILALAAVWINMIFVAPIFIWT